MSPIDSVLLVSFGGPEGPDDVLPFLENVTRGRGIPAERLAIVAEHYYSFGGVSPINEQNRQLLHALRSELDRRGILLPLFWGNRNWHPYLDEAIADVKAAGRARPLAITTSAYSSYSGCHQYRDNIAAALERTGHPADIATAKAPAYFDRAGFQQPFAAGLVQALASLADDGIGADRTSILFTTHSIPQSMAATSGPVEKHSADGGAYVAQHLHAAHAVMAMAANHLGRDPESMPEWSLVYQSRSGAPHIPWLEPDVNDALKALPTETAAVVIIPIGFISDHLEVVWDLDNEAQATSDALGLRMVRVATPGTSPEFVSMLADLVQEAMSQAPAACPAGCCPAPQR